MPSRGFQNMDRAAVWVLITQALMLLPLLWCWWRMNRLGAAQPGEWAADQRLTAPVVLDRLLRSTRDMLAVKSLSRVIGRPGGGVGGVLRHGAGEVLAILGPSGSGKTSLLRMIAGFDAPTRGSVHLHGQRGFGCRQGARGAGAAGAGAGVPGCHLVFAPRRGGQRRLCHPGRRQGRAATHGRAQRCATWA